MTVATVGDIFHRFGDEYLRRHGARMPPSHLRALADIRACRTSALGGHLAHCGACGRHHYRWHSCSNRTCPTCGGRATEKWLGERAPMILPVVHFHVVFTVPQPLRGVIRRHQRALLGALFRAAARSLQELAGSRYGGRIGVLAAAHTWGRTLVWHPHIHCLVPGVVADHNGVRTLKKFLVPVRALADLFRGKFMAQARQILADPRELPARVWDQRWRVFAKPVMKPHTVLRYLARYVHRTAITNARIVTVGADTVSFRYTDHRDRQRKTMTVAGIEFVRRFLQHSPPKGFHRVRYYGLLHPAHRDMLARARCLLGLLNPVAPASAPPPAPPPLPTCPHCGSTQVTHVREVPPCARPPPLPAPFLPGGTP